MTVSQMLNAMVQVGPVDMIFLSPGDATELASDAAQRRGEKEASPMTHFCATPLLTVEDDEPAVCRCGTEVA